MSRTLDELEEDMFVERVEIRLRPGEMPQRRLFVTKGFKQWTTTLIGTQPKRALVSESVELGTVFADFIGGRKHVGMINDLNPPAGQGVYRLKTASLRLYGWAPEPRTLVLDIGQRKSGIVAKTAPKDRETAKMVIANRKAMGVMKWETGSWADVLRI